MSISALSTILAKDFPALQAQEEAQLEEALAQALLPYLDPLQEAFFQLCYRWDIPEHKVRQILEQPQNEAINILLAQLFIARAKEKWAYRQAYPQKEADEEDGVSAW
ncbi:hypothetical protein [Saprospira grandis]|uniref:Uncharacterized protein n=1 Tax=Saprospira grandis (strain Lewin) TaxID=984262 RepID=H6L5I5_SAPGL|nr:hypothetical protein [Saprospira grandis]AFC25201.1 hypothetical protein SGRA_2473 [Saprospira grandis str. Lewin]